LERARLLGEARSMHEAADAAARRAAFMADASRRLAEPLSIDAILHLAAELGAAELGDWCFTDLVDDDGVVNRVGVAHRDPAGAAFVPRWRRRYAPKPDVPY